MASERVAHRIGIVERLSVLGVGDFKVNALDNPPDSSRPSRYPCTAGHHTWCSRRHTSSLSHPDRTRHRHRSDNPPGRCRCSPSEPYIRRRHMRRRVHPPRRVPSRAGTRRRTGSRRELSSVVRREQPTYRRRDTPFAGLGVADGQSLPGAQASRGPAASKASPILDRPLAHVMHHRAAEGVWGARSS